MEYREKTAELIKKRFADAGHRKKEQLQHLRDWRMSGKKICAFGAGSGGLAVASAYRSLGIGVDFFCDNDQKKWGRTIGGISCISPEELMGIGNDAICIISAGFGALEEIYRQLRNMGLQHVLKHNDSGLFSEAISADGGYGLASELVGEQVDKLFDLFPDAGSQKVLMYKMMYITGAGEELNSLDYGEIFTPDQYFLDNGRFLRKGEKITDCGAFDGDTLDDLIRRIGFTDFDSYTCYEPERKNIEGLRERVKGYGMPLEEKIKIMPYAVAEKRKNIVIDYHQRDVVGTAVPLDEYLPVHGTSFLKMDVEGAEMDALRGAEKLLSQEQPNCAICVYHKISDIWNIPLFLHEKLPNHRLLLRHHRYSYAETVCYALRMEKGISYNFA